MKQNFFDEILSSININLSNSQISAISHKDGPALVLAVPGAGKTTVLISRIARLIMVENIDPSKILSITFSKFSAKDMKYRFDLLFGDNIKSSPKFSTIHSFAYFLIRNYSKHNNKSYALIEDGGPNGKHNIIRSLYKDVNTAFLSDDKLDDLINSIGYVKNMMISPNDIKNCSIKNFSTIFAKYEDYKRENSLIDFDDMLTLAYEILSKDKSILNYYRQKYDYIQIDEGQDTSTIQHKIIELISRPKENLFIVADDDQSIYGFRGANPNYLLNFKEEFPNSTVFKMNKNYRSSSDIVEVSNKLIRQNTLRYDKNLIANKESMSPIDITKLKTQEDQYQYIMDKLNHDELEDTAILFRNNMSSIPILDIFDRNDIEFKLKDSKLHFFKHWILKDIIAFLKLSIDANEFSQFERIYYKMKGYISKKAVNFVEKNLGDDISVFNTLENFDGLKSFQKKKMRQLHFDFKSLSKKRPLEAVNFISEDLDYIDYLKRRSEYLGYGMENNISVLNYIKSIASRCDSILDFLERIHTLQGRLYDKSSNSGVFISTMHSSKGLEFKNVFIIDLVNGDFPSESTLDSIKQGLKEPVEEERRLFYVAITRAKENLSLLTYKYRDSYMVPPSIFLREIESFLSSAKADGLCIDKNILHKKFGRGTILDIDDNSLFIEFEDFGQKQLSKSACIEYNLIEPIE